MVIWLNWIPVGFYGVDYLLAGVGEDWSSRWGHSMFRLIVCAPHRQKVSKKCRSDLEHHVVLSFRANPQDMMLSYWKGFFGGYPSKMFLSSAFGIFIRSISVGEQRELISVPLRFSRQERENFVHHLLEIYWEYLGDYKFLTNNCQSESEDMLRAIFENEKVHYLTALSPVGLMEELFEARFAATGS